MKIRSIFKKLIERRPKINVNYKVTSPTSVLKGRCALITGGTSGIGEAIAEHFLQAGCTVFITGRNTQRLQDSCQRLKTNTQNENIQGIVLDNRVVSNFQAIFENLQTQAEKNNWPRIDILVNNAGINGTVMPYVSEEDYDNILETNLKSTFFLSQLFGKYLIKHHIEGNILNVGSASSLRPANSPYILSKWGIRALTLGLAKSLAPHGITVNGIAPGPTATPMLNKKDSDDLSLHSLPLGRFITTTEIAQMATTLVSDVGRSIMGDTIFMTGGAGLLTYDDISYSF